MDRIEIINLISRNFGCERYLEIGLRNPEECLNLIECKDKDSVDPGFETKYELYPSCWAWTPIFNMERNSRCEIEIGVTGKRGDVYIFRDKFGSVGDGINLKDIITE